MIQITGDYRARSQKEIDEAVRRAEHRQIVERTNRFARSLDYHSAIVEKVEELVEMRRNGLRHDDLRPDLIISWFAEVLRKIERAG